jgi:hypothetical protein
MFPMNHFFLAAAAVAVLASQAAGQMPLAWKLKAGEKFDLHVEQQTATTVTVVTKTTKTSIEMTLDSAWVVESVEEGIAKIRQTVGRVQMKVQAADAAPLAYDTASPGQPSGAARDLANAVAPLVDPEASILLTMNERGEIQSVELSPKLAAVLDSAKPDSQSLDALLKQPLVTLPAQAVSTSDSWETSRELATPAGKFTQQTEYTLGEPKEAGGTTAEAITYTATLTPVAAGKAKIKEQSQTGTVLFDREAGRFLSGEQSQKLVTETPYRGATIKVVVESQIKRTLTAR